MSLDLPLILVVLVFGSGLIWLIDSLFFAKARRARLDALQARLPQWEEEGSSDAKAYETQHKAVAGDPPIVDFSKSFFPVLFVVFVLRSFIVEPFQIPSASMVPTLEVGDYILVNKFSYGIRLPVLREKVISIGEPKRGDVMVFFPPHKNKTYYIKRVIGLPGDRVSSRNKRLFINGEPVPQDILAVIPGEQGRYEMGTEKLGETNHLVQNDLGRRSGDFSVVVKPGHYFMMGDNRDNSSDSRVWGQVPEKDIVGRAFAVWMHWDEFFSLPSFERVGQID